MMTLTKQEEYVLAFFLATEAKNIFINDKYYKRKEFVKTFEDRIFIATKKFGEGIAGRYPNVAARLIDALADAQGLLTINDKYSGESLKFNISRYKDAVQCLIEKNPTLKVEEEMTAKYWENLFGGLHAVEDG